jgi:DNA-binding CsgD family transcriptional regulator
MTFRLPPTDNSVDSKNYPLVETSEQIEAANLLALVALSHTSVEHRLYSAMLSQPEDITGRNYFTARTLMDLAGIRSLSTVRRGLEGLVIKLSIDKNRHNGEGKRDQATAYSVYSPQEVIRRRKENRAPFLTEYAGNSGNGNHSFNKALSRVADHPLLSRREAQVALCCVEGLTNAEIGKRLKVSEQTVKFHLRKVFLKFGVKRRAELISKLLM